MCFKNIFKKKRNFGLIPQLLDKRDIKYVVSGETFLEANAFDNDDEITYQNGFPSCVAHSTGALFNDEIRRLAPDYLPSWKNFSCSEAFLWFATRAEEGTQDQSVGVVARNSFKAIKKFGFVSRDDWDYKNGIKTPPLKILQLALMHVKLMDHFPAYCSITRNKALCFRNSISNRRKVSLALPVYDELYNYKGGIITSFTGTNRGNHDVVLGKYEQIDGKTVCTLMNSWGKNWGEKGFFRITEELLVKYSFDCWAFQDGDDK